MGSGVLACGVGAESARRANQGSLTAAAVPDAKKTPLVAIADPPGGDGTDSGGAGATIGGGLPTDEGSAGGDGIAEGGGARTGEGGGGGAVLG